MKKLLIIALLASTPAFADYKYDYRSGNSISTYNSGRNTHVNGVNINTGSTWNTTIDRKTGNSHGMDSSGNSWNYNRNSGTYTNTNGHGCSGHGTGRICW